jgi:membrane fusion protein (multidrug efflux system)
MKRILWLIVTGLLLSSLFVSCSVNKAAEQKGPPPVQVTTYEVKAGSASYHDEYPATVVALNQVELRPEVSGYITEISFKDGQHLAQGAKLYSIDQQQYRAAYDQAIANLNVAKSNLVKAQQDADRYTDLAKNDAVARQTLEHALADLASTKMQVEAAEATVKSVQTNLRYSDIEAPFDGTIGVSLVKLGSAVTTGQTLLNTISSDDPMAVDCAVDEKQIGRFNDLLHSASNGKDSTFTIVLPDQSLYPYPGQLSFLDRSVDSQTGTIRIRITFPNPKRMLKTGLTCNLRVRASSPTAALLIPYRAVVEQMGEYFVFALAGNRVTQRRVVLGMNINDMVIVNNGLVAGDQVVVEGMQRLRDNSIVAVAPAGTQSSGQPAHGI